MTFDEAHERLMGRLDAAWAQMRTIHNDPAHLNVQSREHLAALANVKDLSDAIFRNKNARHDAEAL